MFRVLLLSQKPENLFLHRKKITPTMPLHLPF